MSERKVFSLPLNKLRVLYCILYCLPTFIYSSEKLVLRGEEKQILTVPKPAFEYSVRFIIQFICLCISLCMYRENALQKEGSWPMNVFIHFLSSVQPYNTRPRPFFTFYLKKKRNHKLPLASQQYRCPHPPLPADVIRKTQPLACAGSF